MYLQDLGVNSNISAWSGLAYSAPWFSFALMSPIWGTLSDRWGKRIMILRSGIGIGLTYVGMSLARDHLQFVSLRFLNGFVTGYIPAAITLISANTPEHAVGYALAMLQVGVAAGGVTGPLLGGFLADTVGMRSSILVAAALLFVAAIVPYIYLKEDSASMRSESRPRDIRSVIHTPGLLPMFFVLVLAQVAGLLTQPTLPLFVSSLVSGNAAFMTGIVFSLVGLATAAGALLLPRLRRVNYEHVLAAGLAVSALTSALQVLARSFWGLSWWRLWYGFGTAAVTVSGNVLIATSVAKEDRGKAFGLFNSLAAAGSIIGPVAGGYLGDHFGLPASFYGASALFGFGTLVAYSRLRHAVMQPRKMVSRVH